MSLVLLSEDTLAQALSNLGLADLLASAQTSRALRAGVLMNLQLGT